MPSTLLHSGLTIADLLQGDVQLASPPNIYFELQKVSEDPNKSLADAAFIIEQDAALSLKLLKIVNSAFYGFPAQITSISRAITMIGIKELRSIVLSTVIIDKFSNLPGDMINMHDFWARSLRCALIAQELDKHLSNEFSDSAFLCGLVHNIGQLVFLLRIPELARKSFLAFQAQEGQQSALTEIDIEKSLIGFDHFQTGAALTKLWNLPDLITDSIRLHAYPDNTGIYHKLASIIRVADTYSRIDLDWSNLGQNNLGMSIDEISMILDTTHEKFEQIFKVFYHG
ncbi:HDOD domain-containing protein [methanotrophic endosymbiont of Bathymodiolus puteoserpentis (Logatchev)]|jgi:HD-like signal output (HDOD) protein|uniref:HDOD domain-containing protein n=1 Tax=methanotrophic endosymbiont of Bathymodiolus puteoserpentis (Logatchev) TaxID=343235 RepID=UPI0013C95B10|nr:HDOD domain-containing protein [methanotrophic endosymbiont of Bathymodiolus puteoserpentis (Logatchev)]SHE21104.1 HD domain protein [methanotrophic endosymbiont of Bathymodiolus puteoserpentis (Logatchev)]